MRKRLEESRTMVIIGQILCMLLWLVITAGVLIVIHKVHQENIVGDIGCGILIATIIVAMCGWQVVRSCSEGLDNILQKQSR